MTSRPKRPARCCPATRRRSPWPCPANPPSPSTAGLPANKPSSLVERRPANKPDSAEGLTTECCVGGDGSGGKTEGENEVSMRCGKNSVEAEAAVSGVKRTFSMYRN
eukprot:GDKK01058967.1.p1 GENE.GDKK01058967.1~~GDKK01058967.1.p1  ORF type:complete len:107 (+),score=0.29 GDKK01058967.1:25-345(+)